MKKLLILLAILAVSISLFACEKACVDNDGDGKCDDCGAVLDASKPEEPQEPEEPKEPSSDELALIKNGDAKFVFVVQKSASSSVIKAVDTLIKDLGKLDITVERIFDEPNNATECEVIIGAPENRGDKYAFDMYSLGEKGYMIKVVEGKVMVVGGSDSSLIDAIDIFKEDFLGIKKNTKELTSVTVKASQNVEEIQKNYRVTSLLHNGENMKGYTISCTPDNKVALAAAETLQWTLYSKTGYWFPLEANAEPESGISVQLLENTYEGDGFYATVSDELIEFRCEFPEKLLPCIESYLAKYVSVAQGDVNFTAKTHNYKQNVRAIYYSEFGATNNGEIDDDFKAIKECHEYANTWGHDVYADNGATYYFGKGYTSSIVIKTNTYWGNATFIIDDTELLPVSGNGYTNNIFVISSDHKVITYTKEKNNLPITSITKDATNIGFEPGYKAMIKIYNSEHKNYIRYGGNADAGQSQVEMVLVDEKGNILDDTNLMWDYETVTSMYIYRVDDRPITLSGGNVEMYYNRAPSEYTYYARGILHQRSNTTITGINHNITGEGDHCCKQIFSEEFYITDNETAFPRDLSVEVCCVIHVSENRVESNSR